MTESEKRDPQGRLSLAVSDSTDPTTLRWAGEILERELGANPKDRFHTPDQKFWDYEVRAVAMTLHFHQVEGLRLVAGDTELGTEGRTRDVVTFLRSSLARRT